MHTVGTFKCRNLLYVQRIFVQKFSYDFAKLAVLIEYLDPFHERNFHMMLAYKMYFTAKIKQITVVLLISVHSR